MEIFERLESEVRGYCRDWPTVFDEARGSHIYDESGTQYLDFFAGAGSLNYGHNNPELKSKLLDYLVGDSVVHSLDTYSTAKREFLATFDEVVLQPRGLDYKVQFPGPAGNNAVEAALKLARKYTGRDTVISFTNGFHGMTLGALSVTGNSMKRSGAGVRWATPLPCRSTTTWTARPRTSCGCAACWRTAAAAWTNRRRSSWRRCRVRAASTSPAPSGCAASPTSARSTASCSSWTTSRWGAAAQARSSASSTPASPGHRHPVQVHQRLRPAHGAHAVQTRTGRVGPGRAQRHLPRPQPQLRHRDRRAHTFWRDGEFQRATEAKGEIMQKRLAELAEEFAEAGAVARGRGMAGALAFEREGAAEALSAEAFRRGLLVETAGPNDEVVKLLPPLTTSEQELERGLEIIAESARATVKIPQLA